jgi:hypothetical protein
MAFEINGSAPTPDAAKPSYYNESGVIHFPDSGQSIRGDGHSITTGKPWLPLKWPTMSAAGIAYWYGLNASDTTPSVALTSVQAWNPRTGAYVTYSTTAILHRPRYGSIEFRGTAPIYKNVEVLITELS